MKNADQPAYPFNAQEGNRGQPLEVAYYGVSKREFFAAAAMQGIISNADTMREITKAVGKDNDGAEFFRAVGKIAYKYADAMLKAE